MIDTLSIPVSRTEESRLPQVDFDDLAFGRVFSDHMFIADYDGAQWKDLRIVPFDRIRLSPAVSTIHYGQSIFEGLKAYRSVKGHINLFRPDANYQRMCHSAERMCMPEIPEELFMGGIQQLLRVDEAWVPRHPGHSLYIRPFMFATDEFIGIRSSDTYKFMIFTCPVSTYYTKPVRVRIETHYNRAFPGGTGFAKAAGNYAASLYPALQARRQGYDQLVWTDGREHKYIEEAGTMNVMFVLDDTLVTAALGDTILPGITRDSVLTLAREWGVPVEERRVAVAEVIGAIREGRLREAFGTGTAATIAHIQTIGFEDEDFELPPIESRTLSARLLRTLDDYRVGRTTENYGWVQPL